MMQNPLQINSERYGLKNVGSNKIVKFVLQSPGFKYWPTTSDTCTGLGLPFLNETHGGKIWAQNNPDAKNKHLVLAFTPFLLSSLSGRSFSQFFMYIPARTKSFYIDSHFCR
jgi:hypothetical protein